LQQRLDKIESGKKSKTQVKYLFLTSDNVCLVNHIIRAEFHNHLIRLNPKYFMHTYTYFR